MISTSRTEPSIPPRAPRILLVLSRGEDGALSPSLAAALAAGPDVLVLDPGDGPDRPAAWAALLAELGPLPPAGARPPVAALIVPLREETADAELAALDGLGPDLVLLAEATGLQDVEHLGAKLAVREAETGRAAGAIGIVAVAGPSGASLLALPSLAGAGPRLRAIGASASPRGLGAPRGATRRLARALPVLTAAALGLPALDCALPDEPAALARALAAARRDGYGGGLLRRAEAVALARRRFGA